jgi:Transglycosylase SLT domain
MNPESGNNHQESPGQFLDRMRGVLKRISREEGVTEEEEELPQTAAALTRRQALRRFGYAAGGLGVVAAGFKIAEDIHEYNEEQEVIHERSDEFYAEVRGYEAQVKLRFDEVLFVDETGVPIATVPLQDFTIEREGRPYLLSPGLRNEQGIVTEGIPGEWLDYVREQLASEYPDITVDTGRDVPRVLTVYQQFLSALKDQTEGGLAEKIKTGAVTTYEEIIRYFADKPTVDAPELTRAEFVQTEIVFDEATHPAAQAELRRLIAGLCAQESNFHNGLVSSRNAKGIFQVLEDVWVEDYKKDPEDFSSLRAQVEVAGEHLSRMYTRMQDKAGELAMEQLRAVHGSDEEILQVEVLVPLTLNAYNAGPDRIGEAVRKYFEVSENRAKHLTGRDLFLDIAEFALEREDGLLDSYGEHAREYVPRTYAKAAVLAEAG